VILPTFEENMKITLVTVSAFLLTASAYAMPTVGDDAVYDLTLSNATSTVQGSAEFKLTAFDSSANQYTQQTTITTNGQSQVSSETEDAAGMLTDAQVASAIAHCSAAGGTNLSFTVPAGVFDTCALPIDNDGTTGTVWIAAVAFGVAKQDVTNSSGIHAILTLRSQSEAHVGANLFTAGFMDSPFAPAGLNLSALLH